MKQKGAVDQKLCLICITSSPHHFITPADKEAMSEWGVCLVSGRGLRAADLSY
jgi:hypothetical protein